MLDLARSHLDRLTPTRTFLVVCLPLFALYLATSSRGLPYFADTYTNALTSWNLATDHTVFVDDFPALANPSVQARITWFLATAAGHIVSKYPPGTAILAYPFYLVWHPFDLVTVKSTGGPDPPTTTIPLPSLVPAAIAASAATAAAMGLLALVFLRLLSPVPAIAAAYTAGLGTGAWSVASDALWQHGPAMMWIALALFLVSRDHRLAAGSAFGMGILTRPHLALIAAAVGVSIALAKRSLGPILQVGLGSSAGLVALLAYNRIAFGSVTIAGGYEGAFVDRLLHSSATWYLCNIAASLVDPQRGLLIWAPFLVVLAPGLPRAWGVAPAWVKGAALGGFLYLLIQLKANPFSGGDGFFAYRYPLEALAAAAPLLALSWRERVAGTRFLSRLFLGSLVAAIAGQAIGAVLY